MLRILGGTAIDGRAAIRSVAQRVLLESLVLDAGVVVGTDRLIDLIWGHTQPKSPRAALQNHVSRVRAALPSTIRLEGDADGYRLMADEGQIDVLAFEAAFAHACRQTLTERLTTVDEALELWRGDPFSELDDDRAVAATTQLCSRRLALRYMRAESLIELGRAAEAVVDLEPLCREDPLREHSAELLMRAFVAAGDKAAALGAYRRLRHALVEQLGLDPSPALQRLETLVLTDEPIAVPEAPAADLVAASAAPPSSAQRFDVPAPPSALVGRGAELERVSGLLSSARVVTIVGPGGAGKTRLAIEAAHELRGGFASVAMVDLSIIDRGSEVADVVAGRLGLQPRSDVGDVERILDAVAGRRFLLVLDNCEHVIEPAAMLVQALVAGAGDLTVVATSREPLDVPGEHVVRLGPLAARSDAAALFVDRATAAVGDPATVRGFDPDLVTEICDLLDGLPLAIELAASRASSVTLDDLRDSLAGSLSSLSARRRAGQRHGSIRSLVEWSARDLETEQLDLFATTSVFAGFFTAEAAVAVTGLPLAEVKTELSGLCDRSLLVAGVSRGGRTRFRFLSTIRAYAHERLAETGRAAEVADRHATWVLELCEQVYGSLVDADSAVGYESVVDALAEIRLAHRHLLGREDADGALRLAASLHLMLLVQMQSEVGDWIRETADRFGDVAHALTEQVFALASMAAWEAGDLGLAVHYAERADEAAAELLGPCAGRAANEAWADVASFRGDNDEGFRRFDDALAIARDSGDRVRVVTNLADSAAAAGYVGDYETTRLRIAEARSLLHPDAAPALRAWVAYAEGEGLADGDPDRAVEALAEAIELARSCGAAFILGVAGLTLAGLQVRRGDPRAAARSMMELIEHWQRAGAWVQLWIAMRTAVEILVALGHFERAALALGAVLGPLSDATVGGADAVRLESVRRIVKDGIADADDWFERGASLNRSELLGLVSEGLRAV